MANIEGSGRRDAELVPPKRNDKFYFDDELVIFLVRLLTSIQCIQDPPRL